MALKTTARGDVPAFRVMQVLGQANARAAAGEETFHLAAGQPSTGAPAQVIAAAHAALDNEILGYTEAIGIPPLRERIARHYRDTYGIDVPPQRIVITIGSSGAFLLAFLAVFEAGDRVALALPGYPAYRNILMSLDIRPVDLLVGPETRYQPSVAALETLDEPPHGLILASPSNPAGTVIHADELKAVADWCDAHHVRLVSDEIYHGVTFGRPAETALRFSNHAIVVNSFSKYFCMTGWRLGWLVLPEDVADQVERLAQNLFVAPPSLPQFAAVAAFDARAELDANVARYKRNLDVLRAGLTRAGLTRISEVEGAFYAYVDVSEITQDSEGFCARLLAETGIAITPGTDFDHARGHRFVRFSYAGATEEIARAMDRLNDWLARERQA